MANPTRRAFLAGASSLLANEAVAREGPPIDYRPKITDFASAGEGRIQIGIEQRRLYFTISKSTAYEFVVGVPEPKFVRLGKTRVVEKAQDPWWFPTARMRRLESSLPIQIPPGPSNPLGSHAIYLDWPAIRIHGNNDPNSVGKAITSGCYRLFNEDIKFLYTRSVIGTPVDIM